MVAKNKQKIGVIGAGAWGTTIAHYLSNLGFEVTLWLRRVELLQQLKKFRKSPYLPEINLASKLKFTVELANLTDQAMLVIAVPSQFFRQVIQQFKQVLLSTSKINPKLNFILASKGVEDKTYLLPYEIIQEIFPKANITVLAGPNLAHEVAAGKLAGSILANQNLAVAQELAGSFSSPSWQFVVHNDPIGCQVASSYKNVLAIASGLVQGSNLGANTLAAILTKGIKEMRQLIIAKGGFSETILSLAGIGDLMLTCYSLKSRNTSCGYCLAHGESLEKIISTSGNAIEGIAASKNINFLAKELEVNLVIGKIVYELLHQHGSVTKALDDLKII